MSKLIDADDFIARFSHVPMIQEVIKKAINHMPAIEERPKGGWIAEYLEYNNDVWVIWKCSECGYVRKKGWEHTDDGHKPDALFCETCGADMRGEKE